MVSQRLTHNAIQRLLLKRFALAAATYALALVLLWLAYFSGHYLDSLRDVIIGSVLVVLCQAGLFALFITDRNLRFADPSLTEIQVLIGLGWQTWMMAHLDQARGVFLVFYVLILLFGLFHLSRRAFVRCAMLVFFSFTAITLWDGYFFRLPDPTLAALQVCVLFIVLVWLVLYASYVQNSRQRMRPGWWGSASRRTSRSGIKASVRTAPSRARTSASTKRAMSISARKARSWRPPVGCMAARRCSTAPVNTTARLAR